MSRGGWALGAAAAGIAGVAAASRSGLLRRGRALPRAARAKLPERLRGGDGRAPLGEPWTCECGQAFMVAGRDRHRVYWLAESGPGDPILSGRCPSCDRPLPSESGLATA